MGQDRLDHMGIIGDAELVRNGQKEGVGLRDGFVCLELLDENVWLGGVAATEDRACLLIDKTDLVLS